MSAAYCTVVDIKNWVPETYLKQMSDDSDTDSIDEEKINYAIRQASDYIDSYVRGRYTLPLTTIPDQIIDLCVKIAAYHLFKRSLMQIVPESITEDYKDATRILRDIQTGKFSPFDVQTNPTWYVSNKRRFSAGTVTTTTGNWNNYLI